MGIPVFGNQIKKWVPSYADASATVEYDILTTEVLNTSAGTIDSNWTATGKEGYACSSSGPLSLDDGNWHAVKISEIDTNENTSASLLFFGFVSAGAPPFPAVLGRVSTEDDGETYNLTIGTHDTTIGTVPIQDISTNKLAIAFKVTATTPDITIDIRGFIDNVQVLKTELIITSVPDRVGLYFGCDVDVTVSLDDNNEDLLSIPQGDKPYIASSSLPINGWYVVSASDDSIMPGAVATVTDGMLVAFWDRELVTYIEAGSPLNPFNQVESVTTTPFSVTSAHCGKILTLDAGSSVLDFDDTIPAGFNCILVNTEAEAKTLQSTGGAISNPDSDTKVVAATSAMVTVISTAEGVFRFQGATEA